MTIDAEIINRIINHRAVLQHVSGDAEGPLDISALLATAGHVVHCEERGFTLYQQKQAGLYEGHIGVLPEGRGAWSLTFLRSSLHKLFVSSDAMEVIARVPNGNVACRAIVRASGFCHVADVPDCWPVRGGGRIGCAVFSMTIHDWLNKAVGLEEKGRELLRQWRNCSVGDEKTLGLVFEMLLHRQPHKSAIFLRRWLAISGTNIEVEVVSLDPPRLRVGDEHVVVRGENKFTVF